MLAWPLFSPLSLSYHSHLIITHTWKKHFSHSPCPCFAWYPAFKRKPKQPSPPQNQTFQWTRMATTLHSQAKRLKRKPNQRAKRLPQQTVKYCQFTKAKQVLCTFCALRRKPEKSIGTTCAQINKVETLRYVCKVVAKWLFAAWRDKPT